ncbi:MAG: HAD family phosphatase [Chthonomonadales bacterium]|nr:HAD family phosphatase [Chthonomonadales bacterium]
MERAVIFDLDGVLVDSSLFHRESWRVVGKERGFEMTDELFWRTFGMPNRQILPLLLHRDLSEDEIAELSERKEAVYRELAAGKMQPLPGSTDLVRAVVDAGFRVALGSSTPMSNIRVVLDALGIRECFEQIVCSDDVTHGKPHPEVFLKAAQKLGVDPSRCVVIEDAVVGVQAAKAAGMRCLAVATTHPADKLQEADMVAPDLTHVTPGTLARMLDA